MFMNISLGAFLAPSDLCLQRRDCAIPSRRSTKRPNHQFIPDFADLQTFENFDIIQSNELEAWYSYQRKTEGTMPSDLDRSVSNGFTIGRKYEAECWPIRRSARFRFLFARMFFLDRLIKSRISTSNDTNHVYIVHLSITSMRSGMIQISIWINISYSSNLYWIQLHCDVDKLSSWYGVNQYRKKMWRSYVWRRERFLLRKATCRLSIRPWRYV